MFDIVIPLGPNERKNIKTQIEYTKKNVIGYRNIYIISYDPTIIIPDCIIINENIFPFNIDFINNIFSRYINNFDHSNWFLQQLFKLYAGIIPGILDTYLVIDADVFFLKPIHFIEDNKFIFTTSNEYHIPYFEHMSRLSDTFTKNIDKSGISHHMMFYKPFINEIFEIVEKSHNKSFYIVFIEMVEEKMCNGSGASEYELYFNYMIKYHNNDIIIRELNWTNIGLHNFNRLISFNNKDIDIDIDYVSLCHYIK